MPKTKARQARYCELETSNGKVLLPYELRRYKRMRSIKVTVSSADRVTLKVPWGMSEGSAVAFLKQQGDWVMEAIGEMPQIPDLCAFMQEHPCVSYAGRQICVEVEKSSIRDSWIFSESEGLLLIRLKEYENCGLALKNILKAFAHDAISLRTKDLAASYSLDFKRITIRDQRSLWGACTEHGALSFNWRLILLPPLLMDHVIYHELAHLTHMNHSRDFYNLLEVYDANSEHHDEALDAVSAEIMPLARF